MLQTKNRPSGIIALFTTALIWGFAFVAQRKATGTLDAISVNTFRFALATLVLSIFCLILDLSAKKKGTKIIPWTKETILGGMLLGFILFAGNNLQQLGLEETSAGKAGFISALYIVFVPMFSLLARKRPSINSRFAVLVAIVGFYFISIKESFTISRGDLMTLLCAFIFAFHIIYTDIFAQNTNPVRLTLMQMLTAGVISLIALPIVGFPSVEAVKANILPVLYIGMVSSGAGFTLQTLGQKRTESSLATLIMSLESVFALIFGTLILKEPVTARELGGCLLVFIGVFLAQIELPKTYLDINKNKYFIE